jgi:predicted TIM-barrel fold metal-dependent hydrolase
MGYLSRESETSSEGMAGMVALMQAGKAWAKLTAPYRFDTGPMYSKAATVAQRLIGQCPQRLVWGSDWPHVMVPQAEMPDDGQLLGRTLEWVRTDDLRAAVFVTNPARLYGW